MISLSPSVLPRHTPHSAMASEQPAYKVVLLRHGESQWNKVR